MLITNKDLNITEIVLQRMVMENVLNYSIQKIIYYYSKIFVIYWWGTDSYFNNESIQIGDVEIMTAAYGLS